MKPTLQCYKCKQQILRGDLVEYATPNSPTLHKYCPKCLAEQKSRDMFSQKVCYLFGLKTPGPRIWTERERIIKQYGYTDQTIIDCLDYIYNIEHKQKLAESICLVTPINVEKMLQYKKKEEFTKNKITDAIINNINNDNKLPQIKIRENMKSQKKSSWDDDDYLFME